MTCSRASIPKKGFAGGVVKNPALRATLFFFGIVFVILGFIGLFLPLLPTTPFILLATWCFMKSSEKAHHWIYHKSVFGPSLQDWQKNRAIRKPVKILASAMICLSILLIFLKVENIWLKSSVVFGLILVMSFIVTRRS